MIKSIAFAVGIWLLCGFIGDVMLNPGPDRHLKVIILGPISMLHVLNR